MTLETLRNDLGSIINQVDGSGDFASTVISSTEADRWLNQAFEEIYFRYALSNQQDFEQDAYADTVADQNVYTFGGDATDIMAVAWLGVKYSDTDDDYLRARPRDYPDVMITGSEQFSETAPIYFRVTKLVGTTPTDGIEFAPGCGPEESVTEGIKLIYLAQPAVMSDNDDIPERIPKELHKYIVYGAGAKAFIKMGLDSRSDKLQKKFDSKLEEFIKSDQVKTAEGPHIIRAPRWDVQTFYKRRSSSIINSRL